MSTSSIATRTIPLPSARVFVGGVYAVCVLGLMSVFLLEIVFTDADPYASEGPVESMLGVGLLGTIALAIGVGSTLWLRGTPERAKVGSVVLGALTVLTLVVWWSGAPGVLGACTAWLAGLTRGGTPLTGAARVAGILGAFVALLNVVFTVGGVALAPFFS